MSRYLGEVDTAEVPTVTINPITDKDLASKKAKSGTDPVKAAGIKPHWTDRVSNIMQSIGLVTGETAELVEATKDSNGGGGQPQYVVQQPQQGTSNEQLIKYGAYGLGGLLFTVLLMKAIK
ncbi:MAG: hypothetical protein ACQETE_01625 [Bacteroidota bacterium]